MTPEDNLIQIQSHKEITQLFKTFLEIIEDLQVEHQIMIAKIAEKYGEEFSKNINYFTKEKCEQLRKRILDNGNECERNLVNFLSFFDSTINVEKVQEAAKHKIITKKTIISQPIIL
jgi:hypothetical protein